MAINVKRTPKITSPSLVSPAVYRPPVYKPRTPGKVYGVNYNKQSTKRYAKDLGDIILGNPITGTRQLQNTLIKNNAEELLYVPIINRLAGAAFMIEDRLIEPIQQGNILEAGVNTLETFGSSLDLFANPIKSLLPWAGGGNNGDFLRSMGWLDGEYREYYQWDVNTGSEPLDFIVNITGEILSDPLNWLGWIQSGATKIGTNTLLDYSEDIIKRFIPDEVTKDLLKTNPQLYKNILKMSTDLSNKAETARIVKNLNQTLSQKISYLALNAQDESANVLREQYLTALYNISTDDFFKAVSNIQYAEPYRYYKNTLKFAKNLKGTKKALDEFLTIGTAVINPITLVPPIAVKYLSDKVFTSLWNNNVLALKSIPEEELFSEPNVVLRTLNQKVHGHNTAMYKTVYDNYAPILKKHGLTIKNVQQMAANIYANLTDTNKIEDIFKSEFIKRLTYKVPELVNTNIDDLFEAVKYAAVIINENKTLINREVQVQLEKKLNEFLNKANTTLDSQSMSQILDFLDKEFLNYNNKYYGLKNIKELLTILNNTNKERYTQLQSLLTYLNINQSNVDLVNIYLTQYRQGIDVETKLENLLLRKTKSLKGNNSLSKVTNTKINSIKDSTLKETKQVVEKLQELSPETTSSNVLAEAYASGENIYIFKISKERSFHLLYESIFNNLDENFKVNFIDSNSLYRAHIDNLILLLKESKDVKLRNYAYKLDAILKKLSAMEILNNTLSTDFNIPSKFNKILNGYIFDTLYKYKSYNPTHILNDYKLNEMATSTLKFLMAHEDFKPEWYSDLFIQLKSVFKEQAIRMSEQDIKVYVDYFSSVDRNLLNNIGGKFPEILKYLIDNKVNLNQIKVCKDLIYNIAGTDNINTEAISKLINKTTNTTAYKKSIQDLFSSGLITKSIDKSVKEVELTLRRLNNLLQGNNTTIATYLNKKYGSTTKIKALSRFFTTSELMDFITSENINHNIGSFIASNGLITPNKVIDVDLINEHKLTDAFLNFSDVETKFIVHNLYRAALENTENIKVSEADLIMYKEVLMATFKEKSFKFNPLNVQYFNSLNVNQLKAWHYMMLTQTVDDNLLKLYDYNLENYKAADDAFNKITTTLTIEESRRAHIDPIAFKVQVFNDYSNARLANNEMEDRLTQNLSIAHYDAALEDATHLYKSQDALLTHKEAYIDFINNDVQAYKNCKPIADLDNKYPIKLDEETYIELAFNPKKLAEEQLKVKVNKNIRRAINYNRNKNLQLTISEMNPLQLRNWMDDNLKNYPAKILFFENGFEDLTKKFTEAQLDAVGLKITYYQNYHNNLSFNVIIATDKKVPKAFYSYKNNFIIPNYLGKYKSYISEKNILKMNESLTESFRANQVILKLNDTTIPAELYTGSTVTGQLLSGVLKNEKFKSNTDIQNILKYFDKDSAFFDVMNSFTNGSLSLPNTCFIGSDTFVNNLITGSMDTLGDYLPYESTDALFRAWRGQVENIKRVNNITKYTSLFFNDDYYIDNSIFRTALKDATDKELQEFFNKHNYQAVILKKDKLGNPKVYKIFIRNKSDYLNAIKAKAIVVPHAVYRNMVITINKKYTNNVWFKLYKNIVAATYKFIYLTNPGFLMRNYLDSGIYKNLNTLGGIPDVLENFKYQHKAAQALEVYNKIYIDIMQQYGRPPTIYDFREYFNINKAIYTQEQINLFLLTDVFSKSAAAGGQAKAIEEFLLEFNMQHTTNNVDKWIQIYTQNVLNNPLFSFNNELNNQIENISRLSLFMRLLDSGNSYTEAIAKVVDTHFDYVLKEGPMDLINEIFWFSTFPINNFMYYMNNSLGNSDMLRLQLDVIELSYNNDKISWDNVRKSNYLTYNVLAGNILFDIDEDNTIILKTGSSVLDFFSLLLDPFGEIRERLNPFLRVLTGNDDLTALNPFYTTSNRLQSVAEFFKTKGEQGSLLPSIYNKLYNNKYNKNYKSYRRKSSWNYKTKAPSKYKTPKVSSVNAYINNLKPYKYVKRSEYATLITNNRLKYNKHKVYSRYDISKRKFRKPDYYYKRRESISQPR